jgi:RNA polymerase sigma factor (TIGR02999 family)
LKSSGQVISSAVFRRRVALLHSGQLSQSLYLEDFGTGSVAEITMLLRRWEAGEAGALDQLIPLVYPQLRQVAAAYVGRESRKDLMQATALVHELYFKLVQQKKVAWEDRRHFYVFAARSMRMILIDHARGQQAQSRGAGLTRVPLHEAMAWVEIGSPELIELNRALEELGEISPAKVRLVELRYFLGCTAEETAELVGISKATVDRELRFVKAWLYQRLYPDVSASPPGNPTED